MRIVLLLISSIAIGCSNMKYPTPQRYSDLTKLDGQIITIQGIAKVSSYIKENRSSIVFDNRIVFFDGSFSGFPDDILGKTITTQGKLVKMNWPMFIYDPDAQLQPQGMPMSPGTNIEQASLYFIIKSPNWKAK